MDTKTVEKLKDLVETYLGKEHQLYEELNNVLKEERKEFDFSKLAVYEDSADIIPMRRWESAGFAVSAIQIRAKGEYKNEALWLDTVRYNFEIKKDSDFATCLLITRKE